jgi:hypothetical protein
MKVQQFPGVKLEDLVWMAYNVARIVDGFS